jgi:hypothetical protein
MSDVQAALNYGMLNQEFPIQVECLHSSGYQEIGNRRFPPRWQKGQKLEIHGVAISNSNCEVLVAPQGDGIDQSDYIALSELPELKVHGQGFFRVQAFHLPL